MSRHARFLIAGLAALGLLPASASAATGAQLWAQEGCSGCHTLQAAGATGLVGPNLDYLRPSAAAVAAQVTSGGAGMPSFAGSLSSSEIQTLASWVSASAAGGTTTATAAAPASSTTPAPAVAPTVPSAAPSAAVRKLGKALVRRVQRELASLGYFHGPFTGYYGQLTTAAVKTFQRASGLTVDGLWGPKTQAALTAARRHHLSAPPPASELGLSPAAVRTLQLELGRLGFFRGPDTGYYGPLTTAAVRRFQRAERLTPDGIWGPRSAAALRRRLA